MNRNPFFLSLLIITSFTLGVVVPARAEQTKYHVFDFRDHTSGNAGLRSILVPGWGQAFNGEKRKGALLCGTTLTAAAIGAFYYNESRRSYDEYTDSGRINDSKYDDYSRERTVSMIFSGFTAIFWGYSIVDAFRNGSNPVTSQAPAVQMALSPDGGTLTWQRKF